MNLSKKKLSVFFSYCVAILYFVQLSAGPFPIKILVFFIDHIISALALISLFLVFFFRGGSSRHKSLFLIVLLYIISCIPSVFVAENFTKSIEFYIIDIAYAATFVLILSTNGIKIDILRFSALIAFFLIAILAIYLYVTVYQGRGRFSLVGNYQYFEQYGRDDIQSVDPNMTAFGLFLTWCCALPLIMRDKCVKCMIAFVISAIALIVCAIIFMSRTVILCVAVSFFIYFWHMIKNHRMALTNITKFIVPIFLGSFIVFYFYGYDLLNAAIERFTYALDAEQADTGRLTLMTDALSCYRDFSFYLVFTGCGFQQNNPHNEFVAVFSNSGFFAVVFYILIIFTAFYIARINTLHTGGKIIIAYMTFSGFFIMLNTYGHTKTFWAGLAILLLNSYPDRSCFLLRWQWHGR